MSIHTIHPLAADYLQRLRRAGRRLSRSRLRELVAEIEAHLSDAIDPQASDAEVLTILDRLGEPEEIVDAELPHPVALQDGPGTREWAAIFLLLFGGFVFFFGWLAGVMLLWSSRAWTTRDKLVGTLIIPGGLATTAYVGVFVAASGGGGVCDIPVSGPEHCTGEPGTGAHILSIAILTILVLAPIITAVYLARRAR